MIRGHFTVSMLWLLPVPFGIALAGNILHSYSWYLAARRNFKYDAEKCISTWVDETGQQQSYKYGSSTDKPAPPDVH